MADLKTMVGNHEATTNSSGPEVTCEVDYGTYVTDAAAREAAKEAGRPAPAKIDAEALLDQAATIGRPLACDETLSKWTYAIVPRYPAVAAGRRARRGATLRGTSDAHQRLAPVPPRLEVQMANSI